MKIRKPIAVLMLGIIMAFSLTGCKDKSQLLVKTWKLEDLKYTKNIPSELMPTIQESINEMKKDFTMTFYANGTYETRMKDQQVKGTWKLNWSNTEIQSTNSGGESKDYKIMKLTNDDYEFKAMEGNEEVIFVMKAVK